MANDFRPSDVLPPPSNGVSSLPPTVPTSAPKTVGPEMPIAAPQPSLRPPPLPTGPEVRSHPSEAMAPVAIPAAPSAASNARSADQLAVVDDTEASSRTGWLRGSAAFLVSMVFHLLMLLCLALIPNWNENDPSLLVEEIPIELELPSNAQDEQQPVADDFYAVVQMTAAMTNAAIAEVPRVGDAGTASGRMISRPELDSDLLVQDLQGAPTAIDFPAIQLPTMSVIASGVPDGAAGDPRVVVQDYEQALDRITEEVLWMLAERKVLLVWCFDQSESMKDDQAEIQSRIDRVYEELGLREETAGEALMSAVVSYGEGFFKHMRRGPSSDPLEIRKAIEAVPVDPSGKEMMCQAVLKAITFYSGYAREQERQMALILVTDESGERVDNLQMLEQAIAAAKNNNCRVYVLGREAVFGYPYAHMSWTHPQTGREHWLPIDRGPETAFVEQLQTDGFQKRTDAHPSGFGPYEQTRLARETGGIFFMLPSLETDLVRGERGDYELMAMRHYQPDLRSRPESYAEVSENPFRLTLLKIVDDLNPDKPEVAEVMGVRFRFSADKFLVEVGQEQSKAIAYLKYLEAASKELETLQQAREQEVSSRWQANYDLVRAQLIAYMARRYEYNARLDAFVKDLRANPGMIPVTKPGYMKLSGFNVVPATENVGGQVSEPLIARSTELFEQVIQQHSGTPWAARAERELERGFGFTLVPQYRYAGPRQPSGGSPRPSRPQTPTIPIPRL